MYPIKKEFTKKVKSILTGAEATKTGNYVLPQFGTEPEKDVSKGEKYTAEEALAVFQEALNYFNPDAFVRFLNNAIVVRAQKRANNDLRSVASGLSPLDSALVESLVKHARSAADMECHSVGPDGKVIPVDRKSQVWTDAFRESLDLSLNGKKVQHLRPVFADVSSSSTDFDLTVPGSLVGGEDTEEEASE